MLSLVEISTCYWTLRKKLVVNLMINKLLFFKNFIMEHSLFDLGFVGYPCSWNNRWAGEGNNQEHLDRFLASNQWQGLYEYYKVYHLEELRSNHRPILLDSNATCIKVKR